ncbi:MAG: cytochrome c3 family protein [Gemmatimonadetes bacterium]|nr:cytochrome c3 family protein [Gemmatimonadota bacterium]
MRTRRIRRVSSGLGVLLGGVALLGSTAELGAQLISPGKLTEAHASLEGIRNCTQCHELRQKGVAAGLCLQCHTPLAGRIERDQGFHARVDADDCASCHKEHAGREADIVRFDRDAFAHERDVGYALAGAHGTLECAQCHNRDAVADPAVRRFKAARGAGLDRTFLGLETGCVSCHREDDPHDGQFGGRACTDCHGQDTWEEAQGFDHDDARFRLTGLHRSVDCAGCHAALTGRPNPGRLRFRPLAFASCLDCHDDNHDGAMGADCTACHGTQGWDRISRQGFEGDFDHASTGFPLEAAHAALTCQSCHAPEPGAQDRLRIRFAPRTRMASYPRPLVQQACESCHVDRHGTEFAAGGGGTDCTGCHDQAAWLPTRFDLFRHDAETVFPLEGAHRAVDCAGCHTLDPAAPHLRFDLDARECVDCHAADDPHQGQFTGRACTECHEVTSFGVRSFDHGRTGYALDGAHEGVPCAGCHAQEPAPDGSMFIRFRPLGTECRACHGGDR